MSRNPCGRSAQAVEIAANATVPAVSSWQLVIGNEQSLLPLGETLIGRGSELAVHVPRATISRHHARVTVTPAGVSLEDLGSKNGTFVNGRRIAESVSVLSGDEIRFGKVSARVMKDGSTVSESSSFGGAAPDR